MDNPLRDTIRHFVAHPRLAPAGRAVETAIFPHVRRVALPHPFCSSTIGSPAPERWY